LTPIFYRLHNRDADRPSRYTRPLAVRVAHAHHRDLERLPTRAMEQAAGLAALRRGVEDARMEAQPFVPDDEYCAYCHAPAAGACADCGALCCGDCAEVVMRLTSPRAVCRPCARAQASRGMWRWAVAVVVAVAAAAGVLYRFG